MRERETKKFSFFQNGGKKPPIYSFVVTLMFRPHLYSEMIKIAKKIIVSICHAPPKHKMPNSIENNKFSHTYI